MLFGIVLYFSCLIRENYAIQEIKGSVRKQDLEFVENLKRDLRRDNDDYDPPPEVGGNSLGEGSTPSTAANVSHDGRRKMDKQDVRDQMIDNIRRRVNDAFAPAERAAGRWNVEKHTPVVRKRAGGAGGGATPDARLLDMAPARGGRVHHKRLRGRLCHRHVLVPEGPKYDGGGRAYVGPHGAGRPYDATVAPPLLLPRCCNCCRKSVLGCH